jgi:hypothetical protein
VKRRVFLVGALSAPLLGFARPDPTPRKAEFEEAGSSVLMSLDLPGLFKKHDTEAIKSIDSSFDTTLEFTVTLWEYGTRQKLTEQTVVRKIRRNPWKKQYEVSTRRGKGWAKHTFEKRDDAISFATSLHRVRVAATEDLERGEDSPTYHVEVLALRNPMEGRGRSGRRGSSDRSQGRDLEWFGRLVDILAGERALAEEVVHIKTNRFYLVSR